MRWTFLKLIAMTLSPYDQPLDCNAADGNATAAAFQPPDAY
jgi:hypothetical protein